MQSYRGVDRFLLSPLDGVLRIGEHLDVVALRKMAPGDALLDDMKLYSSQDWKNFRPFYAMRSHCTLYKSSLL